MPEKTYTITTNWKKLKNYNKDGADRLITRISKFDKQFIQNSSTKSTALYSKAQIRNKH